MKKKTPQEIALLRSNPPLFMSRKEAAVVSNLSLRTISDLVTSEKLKTTRIGDRRIIKLNDLLAMMEQGAENPITP